MHMIDMSNNRANISFVGKVPWHGLGQELDQNADLETWRVAAGMNWNLVERPTTYQEEDGSSVTYEGKKTLIRSDTREPLAIVGEKFKIVQPGDVLEFYRDIVKEGGMTLDVAGCLSGGRRYWALAKLNESVNIMGVDKVDGYLLLATGCDGTLATTAMFSSVRTVCNNTLQMSIREGESGNARKYLKIPHSATFRPEDVKYELGLGKQSFQAFANEANELARRKISNKEAVEFLLKVMGDDTKPLEEQKNATLMEQVIRLYQGAGMGATLKTSEGTLWGLVNALTEFNDHHRNTRTADSRLNKTWFGDGATMKEKAWTRALEMV